VSRAAFGVRHLCGHHLVSSNLSLGELAGRNRLRAAQADVVRFVLVPSAELVGLWHTPSPHYDLALPSNTRLRMVHATEIWPAKPSPRAPVQKVRAQMSRSISDAVTMLPQTKKDPRSAGVTKRYSVRSRRPHEAHLPQRANDPWLVEVERKTVAKPALYRPSSYNAQDWSNALSCSGTSITSLVTGEMQTCVRLEVNAKTSGATLPSTRNVNE